MNATPNHKASKAVSSLARSILSRVKYSIRHHPVASNSLLCLTFWTCGDVVAQYSEYKILRRQNETNMPAYTSSLETPKTKIKSSSLVQTQRLDRFWTSYDATRTAQCTVFGAAVSGPLLAVWYPCLERICVRNNIAGRFGIWGPPIAKALADQLLMDPPEMVVFFAYMNACEGGSMRSLYEKLQTQLLPSWLTGLAVWPWILMGTFRLLPVYAQAPFINVCYVVWDGFLSHRNTLCKHIEAGGGHATDKLPGKVQTCEPKKLDHSSLLLSRRIEDWTEKEKRHVHPSV